jgi:hypothetical protein
MGTCSPASSLRPKTSRMSAANDAGFGPAAMRSIASLIFVSSASVSFANSASASLTLLCSSSAQRLDAPEIKPPARGHGPAYGAQQVAGRSWAPGLGKQLVDPRQDAVSIAVCHLGHRTYEVLLARDCRLRSRTVRTRCVSNAPVAGGRLWSERPRASGRRARSPLWRGKPG